MIDLYVIDDHELICTGFVQEYETNESEIRIVGFATNMDCAINEIKKLHVDIVILDLYIKFLDPVDNIRLLKKIFPNIPIIIISGDISLEWQMKMFAEGARAYIDKAAGVSNMKNFFYSVFEGKTIIPEKVLKLLNTSWYQESKQTLLPEEKHLINDLIAGKTIKEIADSRYRTISSIDKSLRKIREKFSSKTNYELLAFLLQSDMLK